MFFNARLRSFPEGKKDKAVVVIKGNLPRVIFLIQFRGQVPGGGNDGAFQMFGKGFPVFFFQERLFSPGVFPGGEVRVIVLHKAECFQQSDE